MPLFTPDAAGMVLLGYGDANGADPLDSTQYLFAFALGFDPTLSSGVANVAPLNIPAACRLRAAVWKWTSFGLGSAENSSLSIRVNNTTDVHLSSALRLDTTHSTGSNYGLNHPLAAGDDVMVKWTTPTWAVNPTVTFAQVHLFFER